MTLFTDADGAPVLLLLDDTPDDGALITAAQVAAIQHLQDTARRIANKPTPITYDDRRALRLAADRLHEA